MLIRIIKEQQEDIQEPDTRYTHGIHTDASSTDICTHISFSKFAHKHIHKHRFVGDRIARDYEIVINITCDYNTRFPYRRNVFNGFSTGRGRSHPRRY